jgi:hypothetical protein
MEKLSDLRFIIGLFFGIVSLVLLGLSMVSGGGKPYGQVLNHFAGAFMLLFSLFMLWQSRRG